MQNVILGLGVQLFEDINIYIYNYYFLLILTSNQYTQLMCNDCICLTKIHDFNIIILL